MQRLLFAVAALVALSLVAALEPRRVTAASREMVLAGDESIEPGAKVFMQNAHMMCIATRRSTRCSIYGTIDFGVVAAQFALAMAAVSFALGALGQASHDHDHAARAPFVYKGYTEHSGKLRWCSACSDVVGADHDYSHSHAAHEPATPPSAASKQPRRSARKSGASRPRK